MESKRVEEEYKALVASNRWSTVYQSISQRCLSYRYSCVEAKKVENKLLNRYRDVNPYDHSRIVLQREDFDYINANLVKVERANRQYILTQGPLMFTSGHFWLMIWEQKCPAIIMLNRVIENLEIKCHWYWPHEKGENTLKPIHFADVLLSVSQISEEDCNYYTIRKLRIKDENTEETRDVWQFHYTTWPDFGVPESPHAFLVFLKHVNDYHALDGTEGPAVVHCSAGIGRSGTFCLVDSVMKLIGKEGQANVDVQEILLDMRRYRMGLIQTVEQLRFSYKAIIEGIHRMDPNYEPNSDVAPEPDLVIVRDPEDLPPPLPPRGESLGYPPVRPLPAIPASASMGMPLPPLNDPSAQNMNLFIRRRARALNIATSGLNLTGQQSDGLPTLAAMAATSMGIQPRAVPPSTFAPLSLMAARVVLDYPVDRFGNPFSMGQMGMYGPRAPEPGEVSPTPTVYQNVDVFPIMTDEDPPLHNSNEDIYISSEDLVTFETSGEIENADMMDIDPPSNDGSEGHNIIEMSSGVDSDGSDAPPTPPPRPRHGTPPAGPSSEEIDDLDEDDNTESNDTEAEKEVGAGERAGLRRRRNTALAERVADIKKRARKAERWNSVKRSFLKPLAISVSVGLLAVAGVLIYSYTHRH